ncbi:MAG: hypothetical protein R3F34_07310 [Planctomycetota bacterium]
MQGLQCRGSTRAIAVEHERESLCTRAAQEPRVLFRGRGAEHRHDVADAGLVRRHDVGVALDDDDVALAARRVGGQVEPEHELALVEQRGLRGVHVLRTLDAGQQASAETDDAPALVADRDDEPPAEEVVELAAVVAARETRVEQRRRLEAGPARGLDERATVRRRPSQTEGLADVRAETAFLEIAPRGLAVRPEELLAEEARRPFERLAKGLQARVLLRVPLAPPRNLETDGARELLDGLDERHAVEGLDEADRVPALAAPEAVEDALARHDVERGRPLVVERAARLPLRARGPETGHAAADDVLDRDGVLEPVEEVTEGKVGHGDGRTRATVGSRRDREMDRWEEGGATRDGRERRGPRPAHRGWRAGMKGGVRGGGERRAGRGGWREAGSRAAAPDRPVRSGGCGPVGSVPAA